MKQFMASPLKAIWEFPLLNFARAFTRAPPGGIWGTVQSACLPQTTRTYWEETRGNGFPEVVCQVRGIDENVTYSHCYMQASAVLLISLSKLLVKTSHSLLPHPLLPHSLSRM